MTKIHNKIWENDTPGEVWEYELVKSAVGAFVAGCIPLLLAKDLAHVSSLCDTLLNRINSLRLEWADTATAQEIHQVRPVVTQTMALASLLTCTLALTTLCVLIVSVFSAPTRCRSH
eukprot:SAG22_NODE_724_length_7634_cov_11.669808_2_plen_117_part_00